MDSERRELCEELETVDTSLGFLLLIVLAVLLSCLTVLRQREAICLALAGDEEGAERAGEVFPLRLGSSALTVGALGYFFSQAKKNLAQADPEDPEAQASAGRNAIASFLVLLAALIRLFDLDLTRRA